jgi:hypothetical protein
MQSYRIKRWAEPPRAGRGLKVQKALAAMSVGTVTRSWLSREAGLSRREIDSLLESLDEQGALERCDSVPDFSPSEISLGTAARHLLRELLRRVKEEGPVRQLLRTGLKLTDRSETTQLMDGSHIASCVVLSGVARYELFLIVGELRDLLDEHNAARFVLSDLARVESALRREGPPGVDKLDTKTLRWALSQLQSLGPRGRHGVLSLLQDRLGAAVRTRLALEEKMRCAA